MTISNSSSGIRPGVCTSTTRPTAPYTGFIIFETDTKKIYVWNGTSWVEQPSAGMVDAKGDLLVGTANDTAARLAVGTNDQLLVAASGETTGLKWGHPTGSIVQVQQYVYGGGQYGTSSTSYVDTNLTLAITPKYSTSKILVMATHYGYTADSGASLVCRLLRGATALANTNGFSNGNSANNDFAFSIIYLDSPATTSSITYKTQYVRDAGTGSVYLGRNASEESITLIEVAG